MTKFQKSIATALAVGSMFIQVTSTVFAATTTLVITGNGADTNNDVNVTKNTANFVQQTNQTSVSNDIQVTSKTGDNSADDNTGGGVEVKSGDSTVNVTVKNELNTNAAEMAPCGSCQTDVTATVSGNGKGSDNDLNLNLNASDKSNNQINQTNVANVDNHVDVKADTGKNSIDDTTGGDAKVTSGTSNVTMTVNTIANANSAAIIGNDSSGSVEASVMNNGADTDNDINLGLNSANWIEQTNVTSIDNSLHADSYTGDNSIDDSTGGLVEIQSGDSDITAHVDNVAGFNAADLSCCSTGDVSAKVAGNGEDSDNYLAANLDNVQGAEQANLCGGHYDSHNLLSMRGDEPCFDNHLSLDGYTGDNSADDNTGAVDGDPSVTTGDSNSTVTVQNNGGANSFGVEMPAWSDFPTSGTGFDFSFSFDLSALMNWLANQQA
jgi:hypothetical protein